MKEMIQKNKVYIIIIVVAVIYLLIMLLFVGKKPKNKKRDLYIAFSPSSVWLYSKKKFRNVTTMRDSYNWLTYKIYTASKKQYEHQLYSYDSIWYVFDKNKNEINIDDDFIAFSGNDNYKVIDFIKEDFNNEDISKLNHVLKTITITDITELTYAKKINLDIDNDRKKESIYIASNIQNDLENQKKFFLIFIIDGNNITKLIDETFEMDEIIDSIYDVNYIIDLEKDKKYEIIISSLMENNVCYTLYSKVKKDYIKQIGC